LMNSDEPSTILSKFSKLCELYIAKPIDSTNSSPNYKVCSLSYKLCEKCVAVAIISSDEVVDELFVQNIGVLSMNVVEESIQILYQHHFANFLASKEYISWFVNETDRALSITDSDVKAFEKSIIHPDSSDHTYIIALENYKRYRKSGSLHVDISATNSSWLKDDFTLSVTSRLAKNDFAKIYRGQYWPAALLSISEGLPVGFCLSSVSMSQSSKEKRSCVFPVVFANTFFETITGHNVIDIREQCIFDVLFRDCKNYTSLSKLHDSIKEGNEMTCTLDCIMCIDLSRSCELANEILTAEMIMSQLPNDLL
jgi:hypothetical protein